MTSWPLPSACPEPAARDERIRAYRYLCRRGARKFWRAGLERADLEQVAALGLIKASDRFDPGRETPFEAFAWLTIVGELMHYVRDHEHAVRVPRRIRAHGRRYALAVEELTRELGREPLDGELIETLAIDRRALAELRLAREAAAPVRLDDPRRTGDVECAGRWDAGEGDVLGLAITLEGLPAPERRVIVGIYFFGFTQAELARRLSLPPRRVSRLHSTALERLRSAFGAAAC